jgi:hypothetical protein
MRLAALSLMVALISLAASACGGSSGGGKRYDAGAASDARRDSVGTGGAAKPDAGRTGGTGGSAGIDGGIACDMPALADAPMRPEVPWYVPDLASACHLDIAPLSPESLVDLIAGPTAFLRVQASITWGQTTPYAPDWTWSVIRSDGQAIVPTPAGVDPSVAQFPIAMAARYDITVSIGDNCAGSARALAQDPQNDFRLYRLRVLPPSDSASGAVPYEVDLKIAAGSTQTTKDVDLDTGLPVAIDPSTASGAPLTVAVPSLIRIQSSGSTWVRYGRSTNQAPFRTVLDALLEYQVLVVPDPPSGTSPALPPYLLNRTTSDNVRIDAQFIKSNANPLPIPPGLPIRGHLMAPGGPATGATISLHSYLPSTSVGQTDLLFSTVGQADADGAYSLSVNPGGMLSIVVTPPDGSPLPTASIDQGINLSAFATDLPDLDFQWSDLPVADLELTVAFPGGLVPVDPVAVRLESVTGDFPAVGILSVGASPGGTGEGAWSAECAGVVRRAGDTDASGRLTFPDLPKGPYKLTLAAPTTLPGGAITTMMIDTSKANGSVPMTIPLAPKVAVMGRLLDAQGNGTADTAGALVVATDISHDLIPNVVSTSASQDGSYLLVLDPGRTYRLVAHPMAGRGLPSFVPLYGFSTGVGDMQLDDQHIPSGVLVHGHVTYAGSSVSGAIVQAFCQGLPPDCVDRNNLAAGSPPAFASAISNPNGDYAIYLPGPAASN